MSPAEICAKAWAAIEEPNPVADVLAEKLLRAYGDLREARDSNAQLEERISSYREDLSTYEFWVAWLERKLRLAGIDPTDMG